MTGPLAHLRVVELAGIGPVPFCGMLLADLGADVIRVERAGGDGLSLGVAPEREIVHRSRRSIELDLKQPRGVDALLRIAATADALLEGFRPGVMERLGLGPDACFARNPRLVYGRMTGYARDGTFATTAGHDITYAALAGALGAIGPHGAAPVPPLNLVADYGGGALYLAFGVCAALVEAARSGRGQVVDAAMTDGVASLLALFYTLRNAGAWRDERGANLLDGGAPFYATYETADNRYVAVGALEPKFFAELVRRIGLDERFVARQYDRSAWPELRAALATIFRTRTRDAWEAELAATDACAMPVLSLGEAPQHPYHRARGTFVDAPGGGTQPAPAPRFSRSGTRAPETPRARGADARDVLRAAGFGDGEVDALERDGIVGGSDGRSQRN